MHAAVARANAARAAVCRRPGQFRLDACTGHFDAPELPDASASAFFRGADARGLVWISRYDVGRERFELVAHDSEGRPVRTSEPLHSRAFAYGMSAAPEGIAVYGWDATKTEGLVQWVGYDGRLGARWTFPGNVGIAGLGTHADGSVTLLFSIFGEATIYGRRLTGPAVDGNANAPGALVAARVRRDEAVSFLRIIAEGAGRRDARVGLVTALDGHGGVFWDRAAPGARDGGLVLWDQSGSGSWKSPLRSVQAAAIDSRGTLTLLGGLNESPPPEGRGGNVPPSDSPLVLERWQRGVSTRQQVCPTGCARRPQLAADGRGRHYLLAQFGAARFLDWPVANPDGWLLAAFEGERPLGCAALAASSAHLLVGAEGSLWVITTAIDRPATVEGRAIGVANEVALLRFEVGHD